MPTRVEQPAIVVLAVDLDELRAKLTQQPRRGGRIVDESAAAAVGLDDAADHQRLAGLDRAALVGARRPDARGGIEHSRSPRPALTGARPPHISAPAPHQAPVAAPDQYA